MDADRPDPVAPPPPTEWQLSRRLFLALLGVTYACAFASLGVQVRGLLGEEGIRPASALLDWAGDAYPSALERALHFPTLFWFGSSDLALEVACWAGVALSLAVVAGFAQRIALTILWALYLSLATVGDVFLGFQWDVLLCEAGLLAVVYAPRGILWTRAGEPSALVRRLVVWLLFRVVFMSGVVKLLSADATWRDLSALEYHYWTQPLPHAWSHSVHHGPAAWHRASVVGMFVIELVLPVLLFLPRVFRHVAALGIAGLMFAIFLTGNYGFFNLAVLALCVAALDDRSLRRFLGLFRPGSDRGLQGAPRSAPVFTVRPPLLRRAALTVFCLAAFLWTSFLMLRRFGLVQDVPAPVAAVERTLRPLRSFNSYGLFAVMTTERPEITIEGSRDGRVWEPYVFRYKPGALDRRPRMALFHMPRLDWQMWFAALGAWQRSEWYPALLYRLLSGSRDVAGLFEQDPFPDEPPRYLRSRLQRYSFSDPDERARGIWWRSEPAGLFAPTFELVEGRLSPVPLGG